MHATREASTHQRENQPKISFARSDFGSDARTGAMREKNVTDFEHFRAVPRARLRAGMCWQ